MQTLQEQQQLIDAEIVRAMIESTPELWEQIVLTLTRVPSSALTGAAGVSAFGNFDHELLSPQGHPPVGPADSLYAATYRLDELLQSSRRLLVKAVYMAKQEGGNWTFNADFEYE